MRNHWQQGVHKSNLVKEESDMKRKEMRGRRNGFTMLVQQYSLRNGSKRSQENSSPLSSVNYERRELNAATLRIWMESRMKDENNYKVTSCCGQRHLSDGRGKNYGTRWRQRELTSLPVGMGNHQRVDRKNKASSHCSVNVLWDLSGREMEEEKERHAHRAGARRTIMDSGW